MVLLISGYDPEWETRACRPDPNFRMDAIAPLPLLLREIRDLTGGQFGRLHVIGPVAREAHASKRGQSWHCWCDCGDPTRTDGPRVEVAGSRLEHPRGKKSCGCLRVELMKKPATTFANMSPEARREAARQGGLSRARKGAGQCVGGVG